MNFSRVLTIPFSVNFCARVKMILKKNEIHLFTVLDFYNLVERKKKKENVIVASFQDNVMSSKARPDSYFRNIKRKNIHNNLNHSWH